MNRLLFSVCIFFCTFGAYSQCILKDSVLTIGPATKSIPDYAYADNDIIAVIDAEGAKGLSGIGEFAFLGCKNLREVKLPATLKTMKEGAFRECSKLKNVKVPSGITQLPRAVFAWCESLQVVELPAGLKDIASQAFAYCKNLKKVDIPHSVEHIGANVFSKCESIGSMVLPAKLKELESYVFSDCTGLKYVRLPANGNLLGELLFTGCTNLRVIDVPSVEVPKFDCDSFPFDPDDTVAYRSCILRVPAQSLKAYGRAHGWELFSQIESLEPTEY